MNLGTDGPEGMVTGYRRQQQAFTLIEILASLVILGILIGLLLQLSASMFTITRSSHQKIEAMEHAEQVLDALGADLSTIVTQNGMPLIVGSTSNPSTSATDVTFSFVTQSRGSGGSLTGTAETARFLAVSYQLQNGTLYRVSQSVAWTNASPAQLVTSQVIATTGSRIGANILRMDAVALLSDGSTIPLIPLPTGQPWASTTFAGQPLPNGSAALNFTNSVAPRVCAITVAVAALDTQNYQLLSSANLVLIGTNLSSPASGHTPIETWENVLSSAANWSGFPSQAQAALQVAQATYPLMQ